MDIKIQYDSLTTMRITQLEYQLVEYKKHLRRFVDIKTKGYTCSRDVQEAFDDDPGKRRLEKELQKIKNITIPDKIEIVYSLHDIIIDVGAQHSLTAKRVCDYQYNINPYSYDTLCQLAYNIPLQHLHSVINGSRPIIEKYECELLYNFLKDIINGALKYNVYQCLKTI